MEFTLVILTFVGFQIILSLGLNLQWGVAGMLNLAYIGFMAAGAYTTAVLVLPKATLAGAASYILGLQWPFWAGMLGGIAAAGCWPWWWASWSWAAARGRVLRHPDAWSS